MKRLILGGLSALLLAPAICPAANAQRTALNPATLNSTLKSRLTPFNLVFLAYQGYLTSQGIPSAGQLLVSYQAGQVSAEDLVKSAVATHRLSPQVLTDREYLSAVKSQLGDLTNDR